jgi:hypothetical protein
MSHKRKAADEDSQTPEVLAVKLDMRMFVIVKDKTDEEAGQDNDCPGHGKIPSCHNFAFIKSTGSSNIYNYLNTFLPIKRIDTYGWIHKDYGLNTNQYVQYVLYRYIQEIMTGYSEDCIAQINVFVNQFLSRFGCWKQLQLSAVISDNQDVWGQTHMGNLLKDFVLTHNYINIDIEVIPNYKEELKKAEEKNGKYSERGVPKLYWEHRMLLNKLRKYDESKVLRNLDFLSKFQVLNFPLPDYVKRIGAFYKRPVMLKPIHLNIEEEQSKTSLNDWLLSYSALCEVEDSASMARTFHEAMERKALKAVKAQRPQRAQQGQQEKGEAPVKQQSPDKFSGWLRCPPPSQKNE